MTPKWTKAKENNEDRIVDFKDIFRIKPEWRHRIIKSGYGAQDNASMGVLFDMDRNTHGYRTVLDKNETL